MTKTTTLAILLLSLSSYAQKGTIIEYNYQSESYKFFKINQKGDTVQVKKPFAYKDIPTTVIINDLNTFYYDVNFETSHTMNEIIGSDQSMGMLSENFTAGYNAFSEMVGTVQESGVYNSLFTNGKFNGLDGIINVVSGNGAGESMEMTAQKDMLYDKIDMVEKEQEALSSEQEALNQKSVDLSDVFKKLITIEFVNGQLDRLMLNKDISPSEMKARSKELIALIYNTDSPSISSVANNSEDAVAALNSGYNTYSLNFKRYKQHHDVVLDSLVSVRAKLTFPELLTEVDQVIADLTFDFEGYENNLDALNTLIDEYNVAEVRNLYLTAFEKFDQIQHADFNMEYSVNTELDVTTLTMKFHESDTLNGINNVKTRKLYIPTVGGLRINSSAGLAFLRYAAGMNSYSTADGTIREVKGDAFVPALTTMFHFYRQTYRPVALGGSFGFGIPTEGDKDFIYMLGASTIFGKSQRVVLNFGVFGGKIERLDGVSVGDAYPAGLLAPTKKVFDFGGYLALTLNINKLF